MRDRQRLRCAKLDERAFLTLYSDLKFDAQIYSKFRTNQNRNELFLNDAKIQIFKLVLPNSLITSNEYDEDSMRVEELLDVITDYGFTNDDIPGTWNVEAARKEFFTKKVPAAKSKQKMLQIA